MLETLTQLIETVHRLRAPGGCPWDREQTHQSLRQYLIEEAYEVLEIIDKIQSEKDLKDEAIQGAFQEELGDLLMQVLLHSEMAQEVGAFGIYDVARTLNEKLIRRHPHVFGDKKAETVQEVLRNWEQIKSEEKAKRTSVLDGIPKGLPALQKAGRVIEKVTQIGFQWENIQGPLEKVNEEIEELKKEILALQQLRQNPLNPETEQLQRKKIESELGDLFFSLCNLGYFIKVSPEDALRSTLAKFEKRFRYVETRLKELGKTPQQSNLNEMDRLWNEAKQFE